MSLRRSSFGSAAEEYDRLRLAAPAEAIAWALAGDERVVLDLAAGTGQISRQLDRPGLEVVAVEPDDQMRAVLARRCPHVRALDGLAEHLPLDDASVDAVLVGTAWHWFDQERALAEIARVLRPGGRLGAIGTSPDLFVPWVAPMFGAYTDELLADVRAGYLDVTLPSTRFAPAEPHEFGVERELSATGVRELFATHGYYLVAGDDERARLDAAVRDGLARRFPGADRVTLPLRAWCWRTTRIA